ncbi:ATP-binding protein [Kitasatospora sp. NBC_01539]|uniref:ATP-binding protein n=1 Tax=Kitasatospora sp. NBC_01539 TaxID=2903577 RepID=UPI00386018F5
MKPQRVELPSEVASVCAAGAWAGQVGEACGLDEDGRYRLGLAVREATANAVLHGNRQDGAKRVRLDWAASDGRLVVTVGDEGEGFTPPPPPRSLNLTASGRGLTLIGHFTDGCSVVRRDDPPGTDVVLVLDIAP